jgi:hypothetical protein
MATKAEAFRAAAERTASAATKRRTKPASAMRLTHNEAQRAERQSTYALERVGAHASRKSTGNPI